MSSLIMLATNWVDPQSVNVNSLPQLSYARDWIDGITLACSAVLTLAGVIGVIAALRTLRAVKQQADEMVHQAQLIQEQTAVAKHAADAALLNAKAVINAERPWLLIRSAVGHSGATIMNDSGDVWVTFKATNVGRSPAEIIFSNVEIRRLLSGQEILGSETFPSENISYSRQWAHTEWIAPGESFSMRGLSLGFKDVPEVWKHLVEGTMILHLIRFVRYRDAIAGEIHESRFCYMMARIGSPLVMTGPAGYNKLT
jgi:hypothetical protein